MQPNTQLEKTNQKVETTPAEPLVQQKDRWAFVHEVEKLPGGENILDCLQCGLCAGTCPTRFAMDYSPIQIIKMIHLGMREEVLSSSTIWVCSSCYSCYSRCPRAVDITTLMMSLRNLAMKEKIPVKKEIKPKFHKTFYEIVRKYGRLHEPELLMKILKKSDLPNLYNNVKFGWSLLRKGRLKLRPTKIGNHAELLAILEKTAKEEAQ
ncbi:MAG: 4Fe-4S dicluster domain-containing protein [Candidatus Bathyarchaeia archaeon]|nr:4Fe-4S dicluster domain-containing protein [Candidatus Bathyarchaeota archaeon A05DMB-4]MDH7594700.1 4Fe-4S dicluster domain-containing protein [Candidatus Bathyarchaeota archaeon]